jgi:hypothetical protein
LIYPGTILDVPDEVIKSASDIIKSFFWNWKRPKIKLDVLIRKIEKGGIKYPCLDCKLKSWKMLWALRALKFENQDPLWVSIVNGHLPQGLTLQYLLKSRPTRKILDTYCPDLPLFYKDVILNWRKISNDTKTDNKEQLMNEGIWLNEKIVVNGAPLYCINSIRKGILKISDLFSPNGNLLSHTEINEKYQSSLTFLDVLRIRMTLPHEWKDILLKISNVEKPVELLYNKLNQLKTLRTKDLYQILIEKEHDCKSHTNAHVYWQNKYGSDEEDMKSVYMLPYRVSKLTILQSLQYKILNKIINCNYWLFKIKIKHSYVQILCRR